MKSLLALVFAAAFALSGSAVAAPEHHSREVIPKFVGEVNASNAPQFLSDVVGHTDKIIGLQIFVRPSTDAEFNEKGYLALTDDRLFSVSITATEQRGGLEMVAPKEGVGWLHGSYTLDGFYIVKSGGMHYGVISVGLEKVNEAAVLLSPKVRVVEKQIK